MTIIEYNEQIESLKFKFWREALSKVMEKDENSLDGKMTNEQRFYEAALLISGRLAKLQYILDNSREQFNFN